MQPQLELIGERFLHEQNPKLHTSQIVENSAKRAKTSQKPEEKIRAFLQRLKNSKEVLEKIILSRNIIKPEEIPENYFENQRRIAREQGHGNIEISKKMKSEAHAILASDQKSSLKEWIDYFNSEDSNSYPDWAKYWAFESILKLGSFDKEKGKFKKRTNGTVSPFPELNREALSISVNNLIKKIQGEEIDNPEISELVQTGSFREIYSYTLVNNQQRDFSLNLGKWVKYEKGSAHLPLVKSLEGYGTGWCTAGESFARTQLEGGDFYVFYSKDKNGENKIPRIAIRMQGNEIAEVRGVGEKQNLDSKISDSGILEEKLKEFGNKGKKYQKKSSDMKRLTEIEKKQELSKEDLRFLYEIDSPIEGFGYLKDPRIKEIISSRNAKKDLANVLNILEEEVATNMGEFISGRTRVYYGNLYWKKETSEGLKNLEYIRGHADFKSLHSAKELESLQNIEGDADFGELTSARGLESLQNIGGHAYFRKLHSAKGLESLQNIGGYVDFGKLNSTEKGRIPYFRNKNLLRYTILRP